MIREEFLIDATSGNLFGSRLIRDVALSLESCVKARNVSLLLHLERIKIDAERALCEAVNCAVGFVGGAGDTRFLTQYTPAIEKRMIALGESVCLKISEDEQQIFKAKLRPPVGELGTLYDRQIALSSLCNIVSQNLEKVIDELIALEAQGKNLCGLSYTTLGIFRAIVSDYSSVTSRLKEAESASMLPRLELKQKLTRELIGAVDASDVKFFEWIKDNHLEDNMETILERLASMAAGGALKTTLPPIVIDLSYRYSL